MTAHPLAHLLAAVHDAHLRQRELASAPRLRARRRRPRVPVRQAPTAEPAPIVAPRAVAPASQSAPGARLYPGIAKTGYTALIALLEAIDIAAADASQDGWRMVVFRIGRTRYSVRQTFANLAKFKRQVLRYRTSFSDKALA